jgi:hypothetical protein
VRSLFLNLRLSSILLLRSKCRKGGIQLLQITAGSVRITNSSALLDETTFRLARMEFDPLLASEHLSSRLASPVSDSHL